MIGPGVAPLAHLFGLIFAGLAAAFVLLRLLRSRTARRARRTARRMAEAAIAQHLPALVRRRMQLVRPDPYGKPQLGKWQKEIAYFVDAHIAPALSGSALAALQAGRAALEADIAARVEGAAMAGPSGDAQPGAMSAADFEAFCAEELRRAGWDARLSPPGRDQGVDVVAEKAGRRLVLQCKLHGRPIGNKAVQEAVAARGHEAAQFAAVVSNQAYTAAAQQLAATNGVLLLHASELARLEVRLGS